MSHNITYAIERYAMSDLAITKRFQSKVTVTVKIEDEIKSQIKAISKATGIPQNELYNMALRYSLQYMQIQPPDRSDHKQLDMLEGKTSI